MSDGKRRYHWLTHGSTIVEHRKNGKTGRVLDGKGTTKMQSVKVRWKDGTEQWVRRKELRIL